MCLYKRGTYFGRRSTSFSHELGDAFQILCRWSLVGSGRAANVERAPGTDVALGTGVAFRGAEEIAVSVAHALPDPRPECHH